MSTNKEENNMPNKIKNSTSILFNEHKCDVSGTLSLLFTSKEWNFKKIVVCANPYIKIGHKVIINFSCEG